jgi:hypothetical protein
MVTSFLVTVFIYYVICCVLTYGYAVIKNWEFVGVWQFKVTHGCVGVCLLPTWMRWISRRG